MLLLLFGWKHLEEVSLHQQDIERIEALDGTRPEAEIAEQIAASLGVI